MFSIWSGRGAASSKAGNDEASEIVECDALAMREHRIGNASAVPLHGAEDTAAVRGARCQHDVEISCRYCAAHAAAAAA